MRLSQQTRGRRMAALLVMVLLCNLTHTAAQVDVPLTEKQQKAWKEVSELYELAEKHRNAGRFRDAIVLVLRILEIDEKAFGPNHSTVATDLNNLGHLYVEIGDSVRAITALERALRIRRSRPESHALAPLLNNLAGAYQNMGDYQRAESLYNEALEVNKKTFGPDSPQDGGSLQGLAVVYSQMGQYKKALLYYERALKLAVESGGIEHPHVATTLDAMAGLYRNTREYDQAEKLYLLALGIYGEVLPPSHPRIATALNNLGLLYHLRGDYKNAEKAYLQALEIAKQALGENHLEVAIDLNNVASLYQVTDKPKAIESFDRSLEIQQNNLKDIFSISSEATMQKYLASIQVTYDLMFAAAMKQKTARATDTALTWLLRRKGIILETLTRFRAAQMLLETDRAVAELAGKLHNVRQQISSLPLIRVGPGDVGVAQEITRLRNESARLEEELNRTITRSRPSLGSATDIDIRGVQNKLPPNTALVEFARARDYDFEARGDSLRWQSARYYAFVIKSTPGTTPLMIPLGEAESIDNAVKELRLKIIAFKDDWKAGKFTGDDPFKQEKTEEESYRTSATKLYDLVFKPFHRELGSIRTVYLSPASQLNLVPFEALIDSAGHYLIEKLSLAYVSSGREVLPVPFEPGQGTVVFANPDYNMTANARTQKLKELRIAPAKDPKDANEDASNVAPSVAPAAGAPAQTRGGSWNELKGSKTEAADVKAELQTTIYGGVTSYLAGSALEELLKRLSSPRVLHVSTHGFFAEQSQEKGPTTFDLSSGNIALIGQKLLQRSGDPLLESGLVLAGANKITEQDRPAGLDDGWVTAEEIAQIDLRATELVVLSACGTALGPISSGEGVSSLRRSFQLAGAQAVISTLFEVPDTESAILMKDFYRGLKQRKTKLNALRDAQLKLIGDKRRRVQSAHPFFWAAFVLGGKTN